MDLDAFVRAHEPTWDRLGTLTRKRRLRGTEVTELVDLYQRTSTHLSMVRSAAPDPVVVGRLTQLVAQARSRVVGTHPTVRGELSRSPEGGWQIVWSDEPPPKPGQKVSRKRVPAPLQVLGFTLDELREARLAPIVDFKGRGAAPGR